MCMTIYDATFVFINKDYVNLLSSIRLKPIPGDEILVFMTSIIFFYQEISRFM